MSNFFVAEHIHCVINEAIKLLNEQMTATLQLDLSDKLNADELRELTVIAAEQEKTLEKVLFDSARDLVRRRRENRASIPTQEEVAA